MKKVLIVLMVLLVEVQAEGFISNIKDISTCSKGDSVACNRIGLSYESGHGVKQNNLKAKEYYQKSCKSKFADGCQNLAKQFAKEKNYFSAFIYHREGCTFNNGDACSDLAVLFEKGKGAKLDYSQAKKFHKKACGLGKIQSCKTYAYLNKNGIL